MRHASCLDVRVSCLLSALHSFSLPDDTVTHHHYHHLVLW